MSTTNESPDAEHDARRESEETPEEASKDRWTTRLKHKLSTGIATGLARMIAALERLKSRFGEDVASPDERPRKASPHASAKAESHPAPAPVAEAAPKSHKVRNVLIGLLVASGCAALGAGGAYSLFSRVLKDQSIAIDSHEQEIKAFQAQEQEQSKKLADLIHRLETEQKLRGDMETHLVEAEQHRLAAEEQLKQAGSQAGKPQLSVQASGAAPQASGKPSLGAAAESMQRPSKASTFKPPTATRTSNCSLAGSDPAALARCIEEYNRK